MIISLKGLKRSAQADFFDVPATKLCLHFAQNVV